MSNLEKFVEQVRDLKDVAEAYNTCNRVINSFGVARKNIAEELYIGARKNFEDILFAWVQVLAWMYNKNLKDPRNEASGYTCRLLMKEWRTRDLIPDSLKLSDREIWGLVNYGEFRNATDAEMFAARMAKNHRTLQQTFSSIIFWYIHSYLPEYALRDDGWYNVPFI